MHYWQYTAEAIVVEMASVGVMWGMVAAGLGLLFGVGLLIAIGRIGAKARHRMLEQRAFWRKVVYTITVLLAVRLASDFCYFPGGALVDGASYLFSWRVGLFGLCALLIPCICFYIPGHALRWSLAALALLLLPVSYPFVWTAESILLAFAAIIQTARYLAFPYGGVVGTTTAFIVANVLVKFAHSRDRAESSECVRAEPVLRTVLPGLRYGMCGLFVVVLTLFALEKNLPVWRVEEVGVPLTARLPGDAVSVKREAIRRMLRYAQHTDAEPWLLAAIQAIPEPAQLRECAALAGEIDSVNALHAFLAISARAQWAREPDGIEALRRLLEVAARMDGLDETSGQNLENGLARLRITFPVEDRMAVAATGCLVAAKANRTTLAERCFAEAMETAPQFPWSQTAANLASLECLLEGAAVLNTQQPGADRFRSTLTKLTSSVSRTDRLGVLSVGASVAADLQQEDLVQECFRQTLATSPGLSWSTSEAERAAMERLLGAVVRLSNQNLVKTNLQDAFRVFSQASEVEDRIIALGALAKFADMTDTEELRDACLKDLCEAANLIENEAERTATLLIVYDISNRDGAARYIESLARAIRDSPGLWFPHERAAGLLECARIAKEHRQLALAHRLLEAAVTELRDSQLEEQKQPFLQACESLATQLQRNDLVAILQYDKVP